MQRSWNHVARRGEEGGVKIVLKGRIAPINAILILTDHRKYGLMKHKQNGVHLVGVVLVVKILCLNLKTPSHYTQ